jgi:ketosteroid isomerase-like protein
MTTDLFFLPINFKKEGNMRAKINYFLIFFATLALVSCQSKTTEDPAKIKQEVEKANSAYWATMLSGDYDKLPSYYVDGAVIMPHGNPKMGVDGMINQQNEGKKMGIKVSSYTPTTLDVWSSGNMVYEIGTYEMKASITGVSEAPGDNGSYMCVWARGSDGSLKRKYFIWNTAVSDLSAPPTNAEATSAQSKQTNPFEGNWELLSSTGTYPDGKGGLTKASFEKDSKNYHMKQIHNNYFMFTGQEMIDGKPTAVYGYGTYTYKDKIYTEQIIYHGAKEAIGTSPSFEMTVNGDTLIQKGPLKIGDFKNVNYEFTETYVRK